MWVKKNNAKKDVTLGDFVSKTQWDVIAEKDDPFPRPVLQK